MTDASAALNPTPGPGQPRSLLRVIYYLRRPASTIPARTWSGRPPLAVPRAIACHRPASGVLSVTFRSRTSTTTHLWPAIRRAGRPAEHNNLVSALARLTGRTSSFRPASGPALEPRSTPPPGRRSLTHIFWPRGARACFAPDGGLCPSMFCCCNFVQANVCIRWSGRRHPTQVSALLQVRWMPRARGEPTGPFRTFLCETA